MIRLDNKKVMRDILSENGVISHKFEFLLHSAGARRAFWKRTLRLFSNSRMCSAPADLQAKIFVHIYTQSKQENTFAEFCFFILSIFAILLSLIFLAFGKVNFGFF